nr:MAG TPA: Receptor activity modifying family [Caudoviricetes sp.]
MFFNRKPLYLPSDIVKAAFIVAPIFLCLVVVVLSF